METWVEQGFTQAEKFITHTDLSITPYSTIQNNFNFDRAFH